MHVWCECGQNRPGALNLRARHGHTDIFIIQNPLFGFRQPEMNIFNKHSRSVFVRLLYFLYTVEACKCKRRMKTLYISKHNY